MPSACLPRASCRESGNGSTTLPCETNVITGTGVGYQGSGFRVSRYQVSGLRLVRSLLRFVRMSAMPGSDPVDPARSGVKLTYDDFVLFADDGQRHELIDGEHYVTPSQNIRHQRISGNLHLLIGTWLEEHPIGQLFYAPLDVVFSNVDVVEPDLLYMSNERAAQVMTSLHVKGVPELVIEIASPGTRKRDETIASAVDAFERQDRGARILLKQVTDAERFGVAEYWVVDPDVDVVRVYRRDSERFDRAVELSRELR